MDSTEKNGQPSMEEILASIRRIIAEEPPGAAPGKSKFIALPAESLDDHADFELPAIFRSQPAPQEKPAALFGRLTDAIRGASSPTAELLQARLDEAEPANGAGWTPPRNDHPVHQHPALSSLKPVRTEQNGSDLHHREAPYAAPGTANGAPMTPAPVANGQASWKPSPPPAADDAEVKRVMTPFKDMRFKQMAPPNADPLAAPASASITEPQSLGRPVDFGAIIPGRMDIAASPATVAEPKTELPQHPWSEAAVEAHPPAADTIMALPTSPLTSGLETPAAHAAAPDEHYPARPPPTPGPAHAGTPTGTIEDTTAELLRPMLRQWLADNMPRMVEKAMRIEVAESVKTGRKPNGQ